VSHTYSIEKLVDEQRFGRFNLNLLFWCFLAMFADGFDIAALASAAPALARDWDLSPSAFGPALSASLFGVLFGAPLLGYVGDRYGRRTAIISGCVIYGLGTLATVWTTNLTEVIVLRFITGIGIGGLMPNTIALNSELAPKRLRATLVVLMFTGITTGSGAPGNIQAWLIPEYGWEIMFWIGGLAPLIIALCLKFALPESVKYLARRPERRAELLATVRRLRPDLQIPDDAQFILGADPEAAAAKTPAGARGEGSALRQLGGATGLKQLYSGSLAFITPLLWLCFATALMANYFLNSWLPLIFESNGLTPKQAGIATSLYHYGGTIGGILVSLVLGRYGFVVIAALFLLAGPAIAAIGLEGISYGMMALMGAVAGFCVLGAQFGNNAASGLIYPTAVRSRGVGWALGIGRFGSILGPLVGGALIALQLPLQKLFLLAATPMFVGVIAAILLARLSYLRLGGTQLDDAPAAPPGVATSSSPAAIATPDSTK
jgi:AAHS family 4-hydroxybenzoate transporter-like MFS transporter